VAPAEANAVTWTQTNDVMSRASSNLRSSVGRRRDMCQLPQPWEGDEGRRRDRYKLVMGDSPKKIQFSFIRFATAKWLNCDWHHIGCRSTWCDMKKYVCKGKVQTKPRKPSFFSTNSSHHSLPFLLHDRLHWFPGLFPILLSLSVFLLFSFSVSTF